MALTRSLQVIVGGLDEVSCLLAHHDAGSIGVARGDVGHDGGVGHSQSLHPFHPVRDIA